jgi:hypothetical protein
VPRLIYSKNVGDLLVIQITGMIKNCIAEVVKGNPLVLKVEESGPFSRLRGEDFIIIRDESKRIQSDGENFVREKWQNSRPLISGLKRFGICDGKLYEIIPSE